jgi:ATP-dependent DNA ligase
MPNTITATVSSYPLPGYPMRPMPGQTLTPANAVKLVRQLEDAGFLAQPKLNGDRVLLRKCDGYVEAWNRHGIRYSFTVNAVADWQGLTDDSLLDGEGWQGRFWPFECLQIGGQDLTGSCVTVRAAAAKSLCRQLGHKFLFDRPADDWLGLCRENLPHFEGVVCKKLDQPYRPLKKAWHTSDTVFKLKW